MDFGKKMKVLFTGQPGLNKGPYVEKIAEVCKKNKKQVEVFHTGELIYGKGLSISRGRVLSLPRREQFLLAERIYQDIISRSRSLAKDIFINGHATFRWYHGLYYALDFRVLKKLSPDVIITLVDDIDEIRFNLNKRFKKYHWPKFTLKDIIVWREEEIMTSELLSVLLDAKYYLIPMAHSPELIYKILYDYKLRKAYVSFPISHVRDKPALLREINRFRNAIQGCVIAFDPYTIKEKRLSYLLEDVGPKGEFVSVKVRKGKIRLSINEVRDIDEDIEGQIVSRDYKMIEQSDLIIAYVPDFFGKPLISEGVERELQHAYNYTKEVYIIWTSKKKVPSPFLKTTATKIFASLKEALDYFAS